MSEPRNSRRNKMMSVSGHQCAISEILNPLPQPLQQYQLLSPSSSVNDSEPSLSPIPVKKPKAAKDGASFIESTTKGNVRYPPCEDQPGDLASKHRMYELRPIGSITKFSRHIPYASEKKSFLGKTGRQSFEGKEVNSSRIRDSTNKPSKCSSTPSPNQMRPKSTSCCGIITLV